MEEKDVLKDYSDTHKLEAYEEITQNSATGKHLTAYNVELLLSDVKGKTVLDLPCGIGLYVHRLFNRGAAKVIACDIVSRQLEVALENDKKLGIPDGFVEYYQHDAKIPKQLCSNLADMCLSVHLFCFAENEDELRGMTRTILANLKPGGCCHIVTCLLGSASDNEEKLRGELEKFEEELVHLDPPTSERFKPRHYHTIMKGFHLNRFVWRQEVICDILREEGFSKIESVPYKVDPTYKGDMDLQAYIDIHDHKTIIAWK